MAHLVTLEQLTNLRAQLGEIILVGGVFDLLHVGHVNLLEAAHNTGKIVIVAVTSDKRVTEKKGPHRPIQPDHERAKIIASMRYVDYVFVTDAPHYYQEALKALNPDVLFFGPDGFTDKTREYLQSVGWDLSKVQVFDISKLHHTSSIVTKIQTTR